VPSTTALTGMGRWHLSSGEVTAATGGTSSGCTAPWETRPEGPGGPDISKSALGGPPSASSAGPPSGAARAGSWAATFAEQTFELSDIVANLSVHNPNPVIIGIRSPSVSGSVTFDRNAMIGLNMTGGVASPIRPSGRPGAPSGLHAVSLGELNLAGVDLKVKGASLRTGVIEVRGLRGGELRLKARTPETLEAVIERISVHDISVKF